MVEYNGDDCRATRLLKEWLGEGPAGANADRLDGAPALTKQ